MSNFGFRVQSCIRFVVAHTPIDDGKSIKPELAHVLRVGMDLYKFRNTLSEEVIIAGFLHDLLEEGENIGDLIKHQYGSSVYTLVVANSKDQTILDKEEKLLDINRRCAGIGKDALLIKAADVYDNITYVDDMRLPRSDQIKRAVFIAKNLFEYENLFEDHPIYNKLKAEVFAV